MTACGGVLGQGTESQVAPQPLAGRSRILSRFKSD